MLVRDIDRKLDMRLVLRVRQNTEFFSAIADIRTKLPVFIYGKNGESWMSTYFPRDSKNTKINLLPKPSKSGKPGWAPIFKFFLTAILTTFSITFASPA